MPHLEYASATIRNPANWWRCRLPLFAILILILAGTLATFRYIRSIYSPPAASLTPSTTYTIDFDVPGTEVYMNGMRLGIVPVKLPLSYRRDLGLPETPPPRGNAVEGDGWGERLFLSDAAGFEHSLMLKVPDVVASRYLSIETPWGRRTKLSGYGFNAISGIWSSRAFPVALDGVELRIEGARSVDHRASATIALTITARNISSHPLAGDAAEVEILWGTSVTRWYDRSHKTFPLPATWAGIAPGTTLSTTVEIPVPNVGGAYSAFPILDISKNHDLIGHGSIYGNSILINVR